MGGFSHVYTYIFSKGKAPTQGQTAVSLSLEQVKVTGVKLREMGY